MPDAAVKPVAKPSAHGRSESFPAMSRLLTHERNVRFDGGRPWDGTEHGASPLNRLFSSPSVPRRAARAQRRIVVETGEATGRVRPRWLPVPGKRYTLPTVLFTDDVSGCGRNTVTVRAAFRSLGASAHELQGHPGPVSTGGTPVILGPQTRSIAFGKGSQVRHAALGDPNPLMGKMPMLRACCPSAGQTA